MRVPRKLVLSAIVAVLLGLAVGVVLYRSFSAPSCQPLPEFHASVVRCTHDYTLYHVDAPLRAVLDTMYARPLLATYVILPPDANSSIKIPHSTVDGNVYMFVLPGDRNVARFLTVWSSSGNVFAAVSRGTVSKNVIARVPDLNFCSAVLSELNIPVRYYRYYVAVDTNGPLEYCSVRPVLDFNSVASTLEHRFRPVLEISENLLYEVPDLNASATLYSRPVPLLEVYRRVPTG